MKRFLTIIMLLGTMVSAQAARFVIAAKGKAAAIVVDRQDWKQVVRAAGDLSDDVRKVTGIGALLVNSEERIVNGKGGSIIVGTIGKSRLIDKLIKQKKLDVSQVRDRWESFVVDVVDGNLVVAGSDKRGTIYGIYTVSEHIGVSPWYWWADVPVGHQDELSWECGRLVSPEPSVKYRGIFINDEDWGLKPWSSKNYEKELGDIGPKTYARVCELLLRLKANMLAPAMHSCTGAFYSHPESKVVCDSFGIVITTSHCEPLLLNNAANSEWDQKRDGDWNYKTNRETILRKWDNRLSEASQYENIYTVAMRGLHDAGLRGNLPMEERVPLIEQVIKEQRELLTKHRAYTPLLSSRRSSPVAQDIPQIFVPYKETMDIYENGLQVPDDITLVWVDDNYGYMKRVSSPQEQKRSGRSGVYYHLSYLGAPHDYLWLNTTPPVLMYEELKKAYEAGADRYWLLNVGDIKPMELGMQTFFDMAWNFKAFDIENVNRHQAAFLARLFAHYFPGKGSSAGSLNPLISQLQLILDDYYRLAWSRKPEFMGWEYEWDDKDHTGLKPTEYSFQNYSEAQRRLADYQHISDEVELLGSEPVIRQSPQLAAAFFQLVQFSVQGACQMNRKFLMSQLNQELLEQGRGAEANWAARQSQAAFDSINSLMHRYNEQLGGKWRGMMALAPGWCALYQKMPEVTYTDGAGELPVDLTPQQESLDGCYVVSLDKPTAKSRDARLVSGLGYDGRVMQLGSATYTFPAVSRDSVDVTVYTVPFWPLYKGKSNGISISVDGGRAQFFENNFKEYDRNWKDQVMRNGAVCRLRFAVDKSKSSHTIRFTASDPGQMLQRVIIDWGGLKPSYVGPSVTPLAQQYQVPVSEVHEPMMKGRYEPTWESLQTHQTPEWFRDAKFGIWAHWGPQCVEGSGDWMAREMYIEGSGKYKYHVEHYGHPSEVGFKDILPLFKAEKWNPEALVERYKRCGAQYFFVLGNHHDNYDLWDSQYQPWNSKNIGPEKDILEGWAAAAKKVGLPLGISFHADHAWTWYEPAQRYDVNGQKAGVYYDGKLTKADGKGKWWEGYDPQMLYQQNHPMSDRSWANNSIHGQWDWSHGACPPSKEFVTNFYDRTLDAINRYQPDLIYFDVTVLPFYPISDCGLKIATHMYNKNPRSVVFGKILSNDQRKALTWDVERGAPNEIIDEPWQTCNCIGGWHYNTGIYEKDRYKSAETVVKQLVDIVSKNGNLLLSIPLRADGTYDEKEAKILDDLEAWMSVNKESIFGTRPWVRFGEGPVAEKTIAMRAQGFNDGQYAGMDARDIRFNQTKKYLYVTAMGWPEDGRLVVKSLAKGNAHFKRSISSVVLLGYGKLKARQTVEGLVVSLPQPTNKIAPVLKIEK